MIESSVNCFVLAAAIYKGRKNGTINHHKMLIQPPTPQNDAVAMM